MTPLPISLVIMLAGVASAALAPPVGGNPGDDGTPPDIERGRYHLYVPMTASDASIAPQQAPAPDGEPLSIAEAEYLVQTLDILLDAQPHADELEGLLAEAKLDDPAWVADVRAEIEAIEAATTPVDALTSPSPRFDEAHGLLAEAASIFGDAIEAFEAAEAGDDPLARLRAGGLAVQALDALEAARTALPEVTPRIVP